MIYRAPERTAPARGRAVTHELAALLVGMALLAAVILQLACAGAGPDGTAGRWICVNNARLAALRPPTATPTGTPPAGGGSAIRAILQPTAAVPFAPTVPVGAGMPTEIVEPFRSWPTPTTAASNEGIGYPGGAGGAGGSRRAVPSPSTPAANAFDERRRMLTASAAEALAASTARALANQALSTATVLSTPSATAGTTGPTPTPGPGTPSVTPGPSPTNTASPTETGYP